VALRSAGLRALAVRFPDAVRRNDYWRQRHPEMVQRAEQNFQQLRLWSNEGEGPPLVFDEEMAPYLSDPFRGTVERRVLAPGETARSLELPAARDALAAAGLGPEEVDLLICCSFLPDQLGVGNAAFLAGALGLRGAAWNLETACSSSLVAFQTACALVEAGRHERVLVVVSCTYSRDVTDTDPLSWVVGDGAAAFVVAEVPAGQGLLGCRTLHTADTCGSMSYEIVADPERGQRLHIVASRAAGRMLRDTAEPYLRACCEGAAQAAGVGLGEIDFFVVNTPTAWYASFAARVLGVPAARTISVYPRYGNIGPVLMPANLYHAAAEGRLRAGQLVLLYSIGSVSSASAAVMRLSDLPLGPPPSPGA
jgi:3-oxoacyl-[acyl-carrier-protein] synthase III